MKNIEIKARISNINLAIEVAKTNHFQYLGLDFQIDTYFTTKQGRFKLRQSSLSGNYLIPYLRKDTLTAKESLYTIIPVDNCEEVKNLFSQILGVDNVVKKHRHIYLFENVRIHLDQVEGLGDFFELEAVCTENSDPETENKKIERLLSLFKIQSENLLKNSYREIISESLSQMQ